MKEEFIETFIADSLNKSVNNDWVRAIENRFIDN